MFRRIRATIARPVRPVERGLRWAWLLQNRERARMAVEITEMRALLRLLAKHRRGDRWTDAERDMIRVRLRRIAAFSPYLILFLSPGGFLALPVLVWWLDRRRKRASGVPVNMRKEK